MGKDAAIRETPSINANFAERFLLGEIDETQVRLLLAGDAEVAEFTLLAIQQRIAQPAGGANQPSATIPPYEKKKVADRQGKKKRKRGGQPGHQGTWRPARTA